MPELPEVEYSRRMLEKHVVGKMIKEVHAIEDGGGPRHGEFDDLVNEAASVPSAQTLVDALVSFRCEAVGRKGKQLWWKLGPSATGKVPAKHPLFHFGMTGSFVVKGVALMMYKSFVVDQSSWPPKFTKAQVIFEDGTCVAFCDARRLGRIKLRADPEKEAPLGKMAPDAMNELPPREIFATALAKHKPALKAVLLDQKKVVSGIGNWMVDEICYQARVHPARPCASLSAGEIDKVHDLVGEICKTACDALSAGEKFPDDWLFHARWGKGRNKAPKIGGEAIKFTEVGGRTTAFVPALQPESGGAPGDEDDEDDNEEKQTSERAATASVNVKSEQELLPAAEVGSKARRKRRAVGLEPPLEKKKADKVPKVSKARPARKAAATASKPQSIKPAGAAAVKKEDSEIDSEIERLAAEVGSKARRKRRALGLEPPLEKKKADKVSKVSKARLARKAAATASKPRSNKPAGAAAVKKEDSEIDSEIERLAAEVGSKARRKRRALGLEPPLEKASKRRTNKR